MTEPTIKVHEGWGTDNQRTYLAIAEGFINGVWKKAEAIADTYSEAVETALADFEKLRGQDGNV
jgi:hypothetical protein